MRPPKWPTWAPPPPRDIHEFKLPAVPTFLSGETPDQEEKRHRLVRRQAYRFYQFVVFHLGEDEANELFQGFGSMPREPGRPVGPTDPEMERELVSAFHDSLSKAQSAAAKRQTASRVGKAFAKKFGRTPAAIGKYVKRALKKQQRQRNQQQRRQALMERRTGVPSHLRPSLLIDEADYLDKNSQN
jgi:hypothetical protein